MLYTMCDDVQGHPHKKNKIHVLPFVVVPYVLSSNLV